MDHLYSIKKTESITSGTTAILGIPFDENSSYMRGSAKAPGVVREVLTNGASNLFSENGVNLSENPQFVDAGDLELPKGPAAMDAIYKAVKKLLTKGYRVLALGGDHAITYPIVKAHAEFHENLTIVHLDAHPDLYDTFDQNPYSHACPFARIMENNYAGRLVQIGIRGLNDLQRKQIKRFNVKTIEMKDWNREIPIKADGPIYLSLDMDVLDPAFAPGVSHHEPGGLTSREVIHLIQNLPMPVAGADIVEFNPLRDVNGITAAAAAKFLKEIAGTMIAPI